MRFDYLMSLIGMNNHQHTPSDGQVWDLGDKVMNIENFEMAGYPMDTLMSKAYGFLQVEGKGDVTYT